MTSLAHVTALVDAHVRRDPARFRAVALQIAAHVSSRSERGAEHLRRLVDRQEAVALTPMPSASGLLSTPQDLATLDDMVLAPQIRERLDRVVLEHARREDLLARGLRPARKLLFTGPPGVGKCLGIDTPVLAANGMKVSVQNICPGDLLMGPDGMPRTVLSTTSGHGELFRIVPIKGEPWVCNDAHVMTLVHSETNAIVDVPLNELLTMSLSRRHHLKQFSVGVHAFKVQPSELLIDPYFLGLWIGDGDKGLGPNGLRCIRVTKPDIEVRHECERVAARWGLHVAVYDEARCPIYEIASNDRKNRLLVEMRSLLGADLRIPSSYTTAPREQRLALLAGMLDSDGDLSHNCFCFTQRREDYARAAWWLARSLGLCAVMTPHTGRYKRTDGTVFEGTYYRVTISGDVDVIPTRIPRKQALPRQQKKIATRTGFSVEPMGLGAFYGFTLDGDGRFLLGDFTVTHNTMAVGAVAQAIGMPLFRVELHGVISQYLGETAAKLAKVFEHVREMPAVYLFDEFDALGAERSSLGSEAAGNEMRRVVNSLLQFIEDDRSESLIVAATNHDQMLDSAIFRRFDETIAFAPLSIDELVALTNRKSQNFETAGLDFAAIHAADPKLGHADLCAALDRVRKDHLLAGAPINTDRVVAEVVARTRRTGARA